VQHCEDTDVSIEPDGRRFRVLGWMHAAAGREDDESMRDDATVSPLVRRAGSVLRLPRLGRAAAAIGLALGLLVVGAAAASAHVTVSPSSLPRGATAELTFRVPDEEAHAATVRVDIQVPTSTPIAQLLARPVPGWTITLHRVQLAHPIVTDDGRFTSAIDEVSWSGGRIEPGEYQDFSLSADPLPENADQVVFKAVQTYSDGDVVRWIDTPGPGDAEPEHPAPVLHLTAGTADASATEGDGSSPSMHMQMQMQTSQAAPTSSSSAGWPGIVAIVAVVLAAGALLLALAGVRRQRSDG
jgi:uncharacterized protein YcnI